MAFSPSGIGPVAIQNKGLATHNRSPHMAMARRFVFAVTFVVCTYAFAAGETFNGIITRVDGNKITYKKAGKKGDKAGDEVTTTAAANVAVTKAAGFGKKKDPDKKAEPLEGGLKHELFTKIGEKGQFASITIADDGDNKGKITEVSVFVFGGKKKDKTEEKK